MNGLDRLCPDVREPSYAIRQHGRAARWHARDERRICVGVTGLACSIPAALAIDVAFALVPGLETVDLSAVGDFYTGKFAAIGTLKER